MTKIHLIFTILFLMTTLLSAQSFKGEEAAVVKALEDNQKHYAQRDYDSWANMWVHEPYIERTWVGPNGYGGRYGWEKHSAYVKNFMQNNPTPATVSGEKSDYEFLIKGNLAIVTQKTKGSHRTRTLEKRNGQWKLVRHHSMNLGAYKVNEIKRRMENFVGNWEVDPESIKSENLNLEFKEIACRVTPTSSGCHLKSIMLIKNSAGNLVEGEEEVSIALHTENQHIAGTRIVHWPGSGANFISIGEGQAEDDGSITIITNGIGSNDFQLKQVFRLLSTRKLEVKNIYSSSEAEQGSSWSYILMKK